MNKAAVFAVLVFLGGCAAPPSAQQSTRAKHPVRQVSLVLENLSAQSIQVTKSERSTIANYQVQITEAEKADARNRADRLNQILAQGFGGRFQRLAASQGLQVMPQSEAVPTMRVNVVHREMKCGPYTCSARYRLRADVFDPGGAHVWYFIGMYGQDRPDEKLGVELFDRFANQVLEQMRSDGLLAAGPQ